VFGSGQVGVRDMARAGVLLDIIAVVLVVLAAATLYPVVFG
jgi:di/tricarboxylate transporter